MVAIVSDKREFIFKAVSDMYTDVAMHPGKTFHFPTGRLACLFVGYPGEQLDLIPPAAPESFLLTGLNPSTTYWFAMRALDEVDNGGALTAASPSATTPADERNGNAPLGCGGSAAAAGSFFLSAVALMPGSRR